MKKLLLTLMILFATAGMAFAQSDLQVLAIVKMNKSESITVKQLKLRCNLIEKQVGRQLTVDEKKEILNTLIEERLMLQAAAKANINIPDSTVDQYFAQGMSQSIGANVTEKELADMVKKTQGITLDELMVTQVGLNVADYKAYLKNCLIIQQYVLSQVQNDLAKNAAPTDEEIRSAYESNKSQFVQNDLLKIFMVVVPKGSNEAAAKLKCNDMRNKYIDKKLTSDQIIVQAKAPDSGYQAAEAIIPKTEASAAGLGMSYNMLQAVYLQDEGWVADLQETSQDYRIIALTKKYGAKMLSISDLVQPETNITVYEYIKSSLSQQKQMAYVQKAGQDISKSYHTPENVDMKKTGDALDKLLNWGE